MKKITNYMASTKFIKTVYLLFILLIIVGITSHAQPPDIGGDVDSVPVDGGLSLLVAAGVGYGMNRMKARKRQTVSIQ